MSSKERNFADLKRLVETRLTGHRCYGHCQEPSQLMFLDEKEMLVGCYVCPARYVSRMVTYGKEIDIEKFIALISRAVRGMEDVSNGDIRTASRYTWDLGVKGEADGLVLREAYWTQNYRAKKKDDPNRLAMFLCATCGSFYQQALSESNGLCPRCRKSS